MKKLFVLLLTISLFLVCIGCGEVKNDTTTKKVVDKTVSIESFEPNDFSISATSTSAFSFEKIYKNKDELYNDATNIVYGTVRDISYFDETGVAMILYDFEIEEVYKGSLNKNDMISILTDGGYVRVSKYVELYGKTRFSNYTDAQIKKAVIAYDNMGMPTPEAGDKYLLFLSAPIDDEPPFPNGAYVEKGGFMGRYVEQEDGFVRYKPQNEPEFYLGGEEEISKAAVKTYLKDAKEKLKK